MKTKFWSETLGSRVCRYEDNIKMNFKAVMTGIWTEFIWMRTGTIDDHPDLNTGGEYTV
jgi:hypothetical protein